MDRTRKATREGNEITLQHVSPKETILIDELVEEKLAQLKTFIAQLQQSPEGLADFTRRVKAFGECPQVGEETPREFYAKLRHWMDREIPQTKSPLHPPRQAQ